MNRRLAIVTDDENAKADEILWQLLHTMTDVTDAECHTTSLFKGHLDYKTPVNERLSPQDFVDLSEILYGELDAVRPDCTLAVGNLAAEALLGDQWRDMRTCNGAAFNTECGIVIPCWHPMSALQESENLVWTGAAVAAFPTAFPPFPYMAPPPTVGQVPRIPDIFEANVAIDTEGVPEAPICMSWSACTPGGNYVRHYVPKEDVPRIWSLLHSSAKRFIFHNAPWDWKVLEAMGVPRPWLKPYEDTMEKAYIRHTEPQALKDLAWKYLRISAPDFLQVVTPAYEETVLSVAQGIVDANTTVITHSPKTGKLLKKPKIERTELGTKLARRITNVKWLAEELGIQPALDMVHFPRAVEYATLDPYITLRLWELWS